MFEIHPTCRDGLLPVAGEQRMFWEQSGTPGGVPALYLHGGPGSGLGDGGYRRRFDPGLFSLTGLEQRGCERSRPLAGHPGHDLEGNTTQQLVDDIESLRAYLGVEAWLVHGVSWGSTLALAYAQAHPTRVLGVVLLAVTTTSREEVDWVTEGVGALYPEAWESFVGHAERAGIGFRRGGGRVVEAYARLLRDPDPAVRRAATAAWTSWEDTHVSIGAGGLRPDPRWEDPAYAEVFTTLTTHYWSHDGFLDPPLLERVDRLRGIPGVMVHGRRDVSSPAVTAWRLHRLWPGSTLTIDEGDGHGGRSMSRVCADALSSMAGQLR